MNPNDQLRVDVDRLIASKNPRLARLLPHFVIAYLKRVVHQDEVNHILQLYSGCSPVEFVRSALGYLDISYTSVGIEKLDPDGRYLFVANHPFGGMDGMMLCDELDRYFGSGRIIVNDLLLSVKPMEPLFIPINKHGRQNLTYAQGLREALQAPGQIATFPAGLCSRRQKGTVSDLPWKSSFVKNALLSGRDIVPVYFEGHLSNFFYNLASLRRLLGIRANIEMLYLVDELFAQRGKHFNIIYGDPIPYQELDTTGRKAAAWAEQVRRQVYDLPGTHS